MSKINAIKIIIAIIIPLFLTGCYDRYELDNLAYTIAIGVDEGSGDNFDITYQIAIPVKITGETPETGKSTYTTYTVSAPSLTLANTLVNNKLSKTINLSHVKLIVYSEKMAKDNLSGHVNVFISDSNIRPRATVVICKDTAKKLLETVSPKLESSPSRYYELIFSTYNYTTEYEPSQLINLYTAFQCPDRNAYATYVKVNDSSGDEKEIEIAGIALFDETYLIKTIEDNDFILAHSLLTNNLKQTGYVIPDFKDKDKYISVKLIQKSKPKISVILENDIPHIKCELDLDAHLVSSGRNINFYENNNEVKLEKELNKSLEKKIDNYFNKTINEYKVDSAMIGRYAKINFSTWQDFINYNWLDKYKNSTFEVCVNTNLNVSQIISHIVPNTKK